jgi:diguanylate cyclase (GGDEF)-like protein
MADINVLVIEDSPDAAPVLEKTLKDVGYKVWMVSEPKEGLELLRKMQFAVVITETRSGKMNGVEVTRAVHKISPEIIVIALTFYSFISSAIEVMEAGAYGYITKPLNTSEIRIVLERAVERFFLVTSSSEKEYYAQLAVLDGLTGLYNRRYFKELMVVEIARLKRHVGNFSLLMIDIDNFKTYNDTKGHVAGDELLKKAAGLFKKLVREVDSVCRYGGEEFVVMLPETDKPGAELVAERLVVQCGLYLSATISVGVATFPADTQDSNQLVEKADGALYNAKKTGKNKWCSA